jgi:predicted metal-dependent hydrolase
MIDYIDIANQRVPFEFRCSKKARRMRMQIDTRGNIIVVAPWHAGEKIVNDFIVKNHGWLEKQLAKIGKLKKKRPEFHYMTGDIFYYFGEPVTLEVHPADAKRPTIKIRGDKMFITLHRNISLNEGIESIKKTIADFYREKAEETIRDRLEHFNEHYGFRYNRVTMRDQKSRWGSCSRMGNINFNWRLIMAPIEVIDYVVVHEMCHLKEMNHSYRFWALVAQIMPEHKKYRKWLKENHYMLTY